MVPSTQKLIHTFGALADLGQEVANTGDFSEMVRTSMHLLLGTLALRRGAVAECREPARLSCVAIWGLDEGLLSELEILDGEALELLETKAPAFSVTDSQSSFLRRYQGLLKREGIEL